jgi:diadenosine tetraphosphate (Ap4A) HIT family hydrolase
MIPIFETENFIIKAWDPKPHIDRNDGGHIAILPKVRVEDRTKLSPELAKELMKLTMIVGEAMATAMNNHGVDIGRINYQENGNWSVFKPEGPYLHVHIYGRAKSAKKQPYGHALNFPFPSTGFYDTNEPLNEDDIKEIKTEIERLLATEKYKNF